MTDPRPTTRVLPPISPTLEINERVRTMQAEGIDVVHLGFGEAGLPVAASLREAVVAHIPDNAYGPVAGPAPLRESVAGYFSRRGLETHPRQVMVGPGSKSLLFGAIMAIDGDVVVPCPSWVSYAPQVFLAGRRPISAPIPREAGGIPDPDLLGDVLERARRDGLSPKALIITQPDNPTGTVASRELLEQVTAIARDNDLWVISDEIYRDLTHVPSDFVSCADVAPDITIITSGLSKSLALGGWRIGVMRVPDRADGHAVLRDVTGIGSEIWSSLSAPVAGAARLAFDEPADIVDYVDRARRLHGKVSRAVFEVFDSAGVACRPPQAGFYLYPDLEVARDHLTARGVRTDVELVRHMLDEYQVAVLQGSAFGDDGDRFRFRVATSLLYGGSEEQRLAAMDWAASEDPVLPPHIATPIAQISAMVETLVRSD